MIWSLSDIFSISACLNRGSLCTLCFACITIRIRHVRNFTSQLHLYPDIRIPQYKWKWLRLKKHILYDKCGKKYFVCLKYQHILILVCRPSCKYEVSMLKKSPDMTRKKFKSDTPSTSMLFVFNVGVSCVIYLLVRMGYHKFNFVNIKREFVDSELLI